MIDKRIIGTWHIKSTMGVDDDGTTLTTRVDASSDPGRIGGDQVRNVRFENNGMVLAPPRRLFASVMQHQELFWERIA